MGYYTGSIYSDSANEKDMRLSPNSPTATFLFLTLPYLRKKNDRKYRQN